MGIPQSSILSVKINSITQCLKRRVDCSLYVDDFSDLLQIVKHEYYRTSVAALNNLQRF